MTRLLTPSLVTAYVVVAGLLLLAGCGERGATYTDTYNSGEITIAVDESLRPLVEAELAVFHQSYPRAKITPVYVGEGEAVEMLLSDSARLIVIPRQLKPEESKVLEDLKLIPKYACVAYDAMAVITHPSNPLPLLSLAELRNVLSGEVQTWGGLANTKRSKRDSIQLVVDFASGSTTRYLVDSVMQGKALPPNLYAAGGNEAVLAYVRENPNALGVIGLAWISDLDDETLQKFRSDIHIVQVKRDTSVAWEYPELPSQYNLLKGQYPLTREIWVVHRDAHNGLGRGFESFFAGQVGQLIVHKHDLLVANKNFTRVVDTSKRSQF